MISSELSGGAGSFLGTVSNTTSSSLLAAQDPEPLFAVSNSAGHSSAENAMIRVINNISNDSLVIDLKQLNDPDSLWKRKTNKLSFGRLTSLGRFYRETDLPPTEKKSGFPLCFMTHIRFVLNVTFNHKKIILQETLFHHLSCDHFILFYVRADVLI